MVIQRWQSVLLLVACAMMACFTFASLGQVQTPDFSYNFTTMGFSVEGIVSEGAPAGNPFNTWSLFSLSIMSALLPLITIFMFKNLKLQKTLCYIEILFICCVTCLAAYFGYSAYAPDECSWSVMAFSPLLALIADIFAIRCISSDYNTLRSLDRMR